MIAACAKIDWAATATFVDAFVTGAVGVAAVIGAYLVGKRQTAIQSSQVKLESEKLKADLFERRLATYEATASFLLLFDSIDDTPESRETVSHFAMKMRESRFLFSPDVHNELFDIFCKVNELRALRTLSRENATNGKENNPETNIEITKLLNWSLKVLKNLHSIFEHDLEIDARGLRITT